MEENPVPEGSAVEYKIIPGSKPEVIIVRNWKEYLGESLLIIFSVLLALILTEMISNWHEQEQAKGYIRNIVAELKKNKSKQEEQYRYHMGVLNKIDSVLSDPEKQRQIVSNDEFHLHLIITDGVLYRYLDNVAWEVAKSHNIASRMDAKLTLLLTHIYDEQAHIMKVEDEIAKVLLDRESRKPENTHATLILMRDNFHGWAVDRSPGLIKEYQDAIDQLEQY